MKEKHGKETKNYINYLLSTLTPIQLEDVVGYIYNLSNQNFINIENSKNGKTIRSRGKTKRK